MFSTGLREIIFRMNGCDYTTEFVTYGNPIDEVCKDNQDSNFEETQERLDKTSLPERLITRIDDSYPLDQKKAIKRFVDSYVNERTVGGTFKKGVLFKNLYED